MKALHLVKTGMGASWAAREIEVLRSAGVEVTVALPDPQGQIVPRYRQAGAEVIAAPVDFSPARPWLLPRAFREFRAMVDRVKPDIIHSHFVSTTLMMRLALGRRHPLPRVFQVPGPLHLEHVLFREADLQTAGPQDFWIGSCRWTHDLYARRRPGHSFLSYYGTEIHAFSPQRTGEFRREIGAPDGRPLVGMIGFAYKPKYYLGQTRGIKGHEDFIDAVHLLHRRGIEVTPVVVGGPWLGGERYFERIQARARRGGPAFVFTGSRWDVPRIIADFDLVVVPSLSENLGGVTEPLLALVPVVATRVGGLPDLVEDGVTGWLVPPRSPTRLADAIAAAVADPAEARRRAAVGRSRAVEMLNWEKTGVEIKGIYERILNGSVGPAGSIG